MDPPQQRHLELIPRLRRALDVLLRPREQIERAQQVLAREAAHQRLQPIALALAGDFWVFNTGRIDGEHQDVAHEPRELAADGAQVVAHLDRPRGDRKRRRRVLGSDGVHGVEQQVPSHQTEHGRDVVWRDCLAGKRNHLIELALAIAHTAVGISSNELQGVVADRDALLIHDLA